MSGEASAEAAPAEQTNNVAVDEESEEYSDDSFDENAPMFKWEERMDGLPSYRQRHVIEPLADVDALLAAQFARLHLIATDEENRVAAVVSTDLRDIVNERSYDELANQPAPSLEDLDIDPPIDAPTTSTMTEVVAEQGETPEEKARKAKMKIGVSKFNIKAKTGIAFFEENGLLAHNAEAHAHFLLNTPGLFKSQIGAYLGVISKEFNQAVFKAFVESFDFTGCMLLEALRMFLSTFRLPGEAAQIDNMMETFAQRYVSQNKDITFSSDAAYVLSFALIMLNTDQHNPSVKNKMTLEQFISTTRGIDDGKDVDREMLESFYHSIKNDEIKMEAEGEPSAFDNPDKSGYLRKQGGRIKTWKKRYFVLTGNCLYYFKDEDSPPKGILPLENLAVRPCGKSGYQFEIYHPSEKVVKAGKLEGGTMKESRHERFLLEAANQDDLDSWVDAVGNHVARDPFYNLLRIKREALEKQNAEKKRDSKRRGRGSTQSNASASSLPATSPLAQTDAVAASAPVGSSPLASDSKNKAAFESDSDDEASGTGTGTGTGTESYVNESPSGEEEAQPAKAAEPAEPAKAVFESDDEVDDPEDNNEGGD